MEVQSAAYRISCVLLTWSRPDVGQKGEAGVCELTREVQTATACGRAGEAVAPEPEQQLPTVVEAR